MNIAIVTARSGSKGIPNKQIIITGHSCGGWMTMMLTARYPNKVGGGISKVNSAAFFVEPSSH